MKIILFSRPQTDILSEEVHDVFAALDAVGLDYAVNRPFAEKITALTGLEIPADKQYDNISEQGCKACIVVCYGGDGTFLDAAHMLADCSIPILGINHGRLGFLTNVPQSDIVPAFEALRDREYTISERPLLEVSGDFEFPIEDPYAFNEFAIHRKDIGMTSVEVCVDGDLIATYRGDGVLLSTPSGSTAYSLSVGGPIVSPQCKCFIIAPIAPHNLTMRPIVVPDTSRITFRIISREPYSIVSLDNRAFTAKNGAAFEAVRSKKSIFLANLQNISFYDTLRNKMMWGMDTRNDNK